VRTVAPQGNAGADLARLIAGYVGLHAAMAGARMAAPLLALSLGYGKTAIGVLVALFALAQVFLALPVGRLADGASLPPRGALASQRRGPCIRCCAPVLCSPAVP
jgi:hypothetical protein